MNKSREKPLIIILITLYSAFVLAFLIFPLLERVRNNTEDISRKRIIREEFVAKAKVPGEDVEKLENFLREVDDLFLSDKRPFEAIMYLRDTADEYNIHQEINTTRPFSSSGEEWAYLDIKFSFSASSEDFFKFVKEIETEKMLIKISEIEVRKEQGGMLNGNMGLKFFSKE